MQKHTQKLHLLRGAKSAKPAPVDIDGAIEAIGDLIGWACGLAIESVDSRDDRERIRNARRYLRGSMRGGAARCPTEDLLFTAGVLARVCEREAKLPSGSIVRLLNDLELPTEVVPRVVNQPASWTGPVTLCPTPKPRTPEEEEAHWLSIWLDLDVGDVDEDDDEDYGTPCSFERKAA